jgi:hypothetical protein
MPLRSAACGFHLGLAWLWFSPGKPLTASRLAHRPTIATLAPAKYALVSSCRAGRQPAAMLACDQASPRAREHSRAYLALHGQGSLPRSLTLTTGRVTVTAPASWSTHVTLAYSPSRLAPLTVTASQSPSRLDRFPSQPAQPPSRPRAFTVTARASSCAHISADLGHRHGSLPHRHSFRLTVTAAH